MTFGILLPDSHPIKQKANFYVPSLTLGNDTEPSHSLKASHLFLHTQSSSIENLKLEILHTQIPPEVTTIIRLPKWADFKEIYHALESLPQKTAVIVPIIQDKQYFFMLRDTCVQKSGSPELILEFEATVSQDTLSRYKCINYMAIYIPKFEETFVSQIANLLLKLTHPALILTPEVSSSEPYSFWHSLSTPEFPMLSDVLIDPLQPLAVDMDLDVYETFEKDHTKYSQYELAVEMAISDLRQSRNIIHILVIGPGQGPLLRMVMKYAQPQDQIVAVEKNPKCHQILAAMCEQWPQKVELLEGDVRLLDHAQLRTFDLVVSELLGSFGCNEAAPEILDVFRDLSPVMIPQAVRSYVHPIYTDFSFHKYPVRPYLIQLNNFYAVCKPVEVFEFVYPGANDLSPEKTVVFNAEDGEISTCLYGHFEADLYGPYRIGILPEQGKLEYCNSWFPIVFPNYRTTFPVSVTFKRKSGSSLAYEWVVNGESYGANYEVGLN